MKIKCSPSNIHDRISVSHNNWSLYLKFWTLEMMDITDWVFDCTKNPHIGTQCTSIYTPWIWIDFVETVG